MSDDTGSIEELRAFILHYAENDLLGSLEKKCADALREKKGIAYTVELRFWSIFASIRKGQFDRSVQELERLKHQSRGALILPILAASVFAHSRCELVDHAMISKLNDEIRKEERDADEDSLILLAHFHRLSKDVSSLTEAQRAVSKALKANKTSLRALTLKGRLELSQPNLTPEMLKTAARCFQPGLKEQRLDSLLALTEYFVVQNQMRKAVEAVNQTIARYTWYTPAVMTKAKLLLACGDWSQARASANQCVEQDPYSVEALQIIALHELVQNGNASDVEDALEDLSRSLSKSEKRNAEIHRAVSAPLARLIGENNKLLRETLALVERAANASPNDASYLCECAYQHTLRGEVSAGLRLYRQAAKIDNSNARAIEGTIRCQLLEGNVREAREQLEFYAVVADTVGETPEIIFLNARLALVMENDKEKHVSLIDSALKLHFDRLKRCGAPRNSLAWFECFNAHFLIQLAKEYLAHCPDDPLKTSDTITKPLKRAMGLLSKILKIAPGSRSAKLLLARCNFIVGTADAFRVAESLVSDAASSDPSDSRSALLVARIALHRKRFDAASRALDDALSKDFSVRQNPQFCLIKSQVLVSMDKLEEAKETLESALKLPLFKIYVDVRKQTDTSASKTQDQRRRRRTAASSKREDVSPPPRVPSDLVSVLSKLYERIAAVCHALNEPEKAASYIETALRVFDGTPQEIKLRIAESRHAVERGEEKKALRLLARLIRKGKEDQTDVSEGWIQATMVKADIYLLHRHNKSGYTRCYETIASRMKSKRGYVLLGDSFIRIQEPMKAIRAYERALNLEPSDVSLSLMIGETLMTTHNFQGAVEYFTRALSSNLVPGARKTDIRVALAKLYSKLERWSDAREVLRVALAQKKMHESAESKVGGGSSSTAESIASLAESVQIMLASADVSFGSGDDSTALETLHRAKSIQTEILKKLGQKSSAAAPHRKIAADICCRIGTQLVTFSGDGKKSERDKKAVTLFEDALAFDRTHEESLLHMAKLHLFRGDIEDCEKMCKALLRINPNHTDVSVILADALSMKNDATPAIYHFTELLQQRPDNFDVLARVISLLWRQGKLKSAKRLLERAKRTSHGASHSAGYHYCQGLYYRYAMEPDKAVSSFNKARRDGEWGRRAIEGIVRVYISPGGIGTYLWDLQSLDDEGEAEEARRVIECLMLEPPMLPHTNADTVRLCYARMLTQHGPSVKEAQKQLIRIIQQDKSFVPALLCMSVALQMIGQAPKARNQLKRICKLKYNRMYAAEFEEAYLMLATIYVNSKKYDLALDLCKRCLSYNQSCARAWEHMGLIMEMEYAYKDAADYYGKAWYHGEEASAPIGFKLAFNYLKAKRYIESIDVCHKVLRKFPDYPKIRKDVLDKARTALRS